VRTNAINALYGGQHYRASDGDGRHERGEYGATAEQYGAAAAGDQGVPWGQPVSDDPGLLSSIGHGVLDVVGLVPVVGEPADAANAAWYTAEGDYTNAALSAAAMVPIAGWTATGGKFASRASGWSAPPTAPALGSRADPRWCPDTPRGCHSPRAISSRLARSTSGSIPLRVKERVTTLTGQTRRDL
jgi:hypothetical protein